MKIFGYICAVLTGLVACFMFSFVSQSVSQYDYIIAIFLVPFLWICFFALFVAVTAKGRFDFLGWPRFLQFLGVAVACISLSGLTAVSAAFHGSGGREFPWSVAPFCPWAAIILPLSLAVIGVLWLDPDRFGLTERGPRIVFGIAVAAALYSNVAFLVELGVHGQREADEKARADLLFVQQADAEKDFNQLLRFSSRFERPDTRQAALQKVVATGPKFNALMIECLKAPVFAEGLTYLRDNDPPGDTAPLAEPASAAIVLAAERLRGDFAAGREMKSAEVELLVDTVLTVADKFSKYGVDFVPAVREFRAALDVPKYGKVSTSSAQKLDKWLAIHSK